MTKWIAKMGLWDRIKKVLRLLAGVSVTGMGIAEAPYWSLIAIGAFGIMAEILDIVITDDNKNGIVDLSEDQL